MRGREDEAEAHQQMGQVAQHNHSCPSELIAEFAYQRCGNDERDIEQKTHQSQLEHVWMHAKFLIYRIIIS